MHRREDPDRMPMLRPRSQCQERCYRQPAPLALELQLGNQFTPLAARPYLYDSKFIFLYWGPGRKVVRSDIRLKLSWTHFDEPRYAPRSSDFHRRWRSLALDAPPPTPRKSRAEIPFSTPTAQGLKDVAGARRRSASEHPKEKECTHRTQPMPQ